MVVLSITQRFAKRSTKRAPWYTVYLFQIDKTDITAKVVEMTTNAMKDKNEHIKLWILDMKREENSSRIQKQKVTQKLKNHNCPKCKKGFSEPKLIQYYVCPHCETKFEQEMETTNACSHWFGFLSLKDRSIAIPKECNECTLVLECMLNAQASKQAVNQIKKWF